MKKILSVLISSVLSFVVTAQDMTAQQYIAKYKSLAIESMMEFGIPASVKLAQGLIETSNGNSFLAQQANNHFGIKCKSNWTGETINYDDDAKGECFRKYSSDKDSYRDHSIFLSDSPRYAALFQLDPLDYRGWAKGLSSSGYATNPKYALLLIKAIEDNELFYIDEEVSGSEGGLIERSESVVAESSNQLDSGDDNDIVQNATSETSVGASGAVASVTKIQYVKPKGSEEQVEQSSEDVGDKLKNLLSRKEKKKAKKEKDNVASKPAATVSKTGAVAVVLPVKSATQQTTTSSTVYTPTTQYSGPRVDVNEYLLYKSGVRDSYAVNGARFVVAKRGDNFTSIAKDMKSSASKLLSYNDIKGVDRAIREGSIVYVSAKKSKVSSGYKIHTVAKGETLHFISQKYGIKLSSLASLNGMNEGYTVSVGQRIKLQ